MHRRANAPTAASFFVSSRLSLVAVDSFLKARQNDEATGYIAPIGNIVIPNKGEYTFSAYFTLGTVQQIRDYAYSLHSKVNQASEPTA